MFVITRANSNKIQREVTVIKILHISGIGMAPHFLLLLHFMSSLCLGGKKEKTHLVSHAEQNRQFEIKTTGIEEKGSDYQNDDKCDILYAL